MPYYFADNPEYVDVPTKLIVRDMNEEDLKDLRSVMKQKKTSQGVPFKFNVNESSDGGRVGVEIIYDKPEGTYILCRLHNCNKHYILIFIIYVLFNRCLWIPEKVVGTIIETIARI